MDNLLAELFYFCESSPVMDIHDKLYRFKYFESKIMKIKK